MTEDPPEDDSSDGGTRPFHSSPLVNHDFVQKLPRMTRFMRTFDIYDAHFYLLPVYSTCYLENLDWITQRKAVSLAARIASLTHPDIWERRNQSDHILIWTHDFGACSTLNISDSHFYFTQLVNTIGLSYYAAKNSPCFREGHDIAIPMKTQDEFYSIDAIPHTSQKTYLAYFRGQIQWEISQAQNYSDGIRETIYSLTSNSLGDQVLKPFGQRQKVACLISYR